MVRKLLAGLPERHSTSSQNIIDRKKKNNAKQQKLAKQNHKWQ